MEPENPLLDDHVLSLCRRPDEPRVCFVATASGDSERYLTRFHEAFDGRECVASELLLFERSVADIDSFLLEQDVIYVGGGNTASMLAVWRVHGVDRALHAAWEAGVVLCGLSAGMNCWFDACTTDSFNLGALDALHDGLGFLPGSACPHYDGEEQRRPLFLRLVGEGVLPDGWAADDGCGLVFDGTELVEAVGSRPGARGYRVERVERDSGGGGEAVERELPTRYLG
jgi:dipeptidase E